MSETILYYKNNPISFNFSNNNKMVNATQMGKAEGKQAAHFLRLSATKSYIKALKKIHYANTHSEDDSVYYTVNGGSFIGTWMCRQLALRFAQWLSPEFAIWIDRQIIELLTKGTVSIVKLSPAQQLLQNAQLLVEQEQKLIEHNNRLERLEAKATTRPEYFTIAGFGSLNGVSVNLKLAAALGRKAASICRKKGLLMDSIPDPRFGTVKMYPSNVLNEVFGL